MEVTAATLLQLLPSIQKALYLKVNTLIIKQKKGSGRIDNDFAKIETAYMMLDALLSYLPDGTVIFPGSAGYADIDTSTLVIGSTKPNANNQGVMLTRTAETIFDGPFNSYGLTASQTLNNIIAAIEAASAYTVVNNNPTLRVNEPTGNTNNSPIRLTFKKYHQTFTAPIYNLIIPPSLGVNVIAARYRPSINDNFILLYDGDQANFIYVDNTGDNGTPPIGNGVAPFIFRTLQPGSGRVVYYTLDMTLGEMWFFTFFGSGFGQISGSFTPASTKADSVLKTGDAMYWVAGGNYLRLSASVPTNFTTSSATGIPDDEYLVWNSVSGLIHSHSRNSGVLTQLAMSGTLTTVNLTFILAGRIGYYNDGTISRYIAAVYNTRIYHIMDDTFNIISTIDLDDYNMPTISGVILKDCHVFGTAIYLVSTSNVVIACDINGPLNSLGGTILDIADGGGNPSLKGVVLRTLYMDGIEEQPEAFVEANEVGGQPSVIWDADDNCLLPDEAYLIIEQLTSFLNIGNCNLNQFNSDTDTISGRFLQTASGNPMSTSSGDLISV